MEISVLYIFTYGREMDNHLDNHFYIFVDQVCNDRMIVSILRRSISLSYRNVYTRLVIMIFSMILQIRRSLHIGSHKFQKWLSKWLSISLS